jgi:hypothetical protein
MLSRPYSPDFRKLAMSDLTNAADTPELGTNLRNFMANRGAIIIKETKPIGTVEGDYGSVLEVETVALRLIKGAEQKDAFGALLTLKNQKNDLEEKVHLDYEEIEELIEALKVIRQTSEEIGMTIMDYTEVIYATKDNAKFGFFQSNSAQTGFVSIGHRSNLFQQVHDNVYIEGLLRDAVSHLWTKGAEGSKG